LKVSPGRLRKGTSCFSGPFATGGWLEPLGEPRPS